MDSKLDEGIISRKYMKLKTSEQSPIFQKYMLKYFGVKNYDVCSFPQWFRKNWG